MKRLVVCVLMVCVVLVGETAWAQTPADPPGWHREKIEILVPDASAAVAAPTPAVPYQGQSSANASAVGSGSSAYASVDPNFYTPFAGGMQGYGFPQGPVWQPSCQTPRVRVQDHWIHQRLTTTVYPPSGPALLPPPQIRCRGNLFGRCKCARHAGGGGGIGLDAGVNVRVGFGGYH